MAVSFPQVVSNFYSNIFCSKEMDWMSQNAIECRLKIHVQIAYTFNKF